MSKFRRLTLLYLPISTSLSVSSRVLGLFVTHKIYVKMMILIIESSIGSSFSEALLTIWRLRTKKENKLYAMNLFSISYSHFQNIGLLTY